MGKALPLKRLRERRGQRGLPTATGHRQDLHPHPAAHPRPPGKAPEAARTLLLPMERRGPSEPPRPGSLQAAEGGGGGRPRCPGVRAGPTLPLLCSRARPALTRVVHHAGLAALRERPPCGETRAITPRHRDPHREPRGGQGEGVGGRGLAVAHRLRGRWSPHARPCRCRCRSHPQRPQPDGGGAACAQPRRSPP